MVTSTRTIFICNIILSLFLYTSSTQASRTDQNNTMAEFVGTYKFTKDDGKFDDFLSAMGKFNE